MDIPVLTPGPTTRGSHEKYFLLISFKIGIDGLGFHIIKPDEFFDEYPVLIGSTCPFGSDTPMGHKFFSREQTYDIIGVAHIDGQ